jgi:hypothetical protein
MQYMDMMRRRDGNEVKVRNENTVSAPNTDLSKADAILRVKINVNDCFTTAEYSIVRALRNTLL